MTTGNSIPNTVILAAVALAMALTAPAQAATCNVPSVSYPDIQTAVDDVSCTPIVVAAGTYLETVVIDRDLTLDGAGSDQTFLLGQIQATAGVVHLKRLHITAPADALWAHSGGEISGFDLVVVNGAVQLNSIFFDGFESGDPTEWTAVLP